MTGIRTNLTPLAPLDPLAQKVADLEARLAKLESVVKVGTNDVTVKCSGMIAIQGGSVEIKGSQNVIVDAAASVAVKSLGITTIKGGMVNIN
jgi:hypothetical protein